MRTTIRCTVRGVLVAALLLLFAAPATHAGGLYLTQVGSPSSVGTAGASNVTNRWGADSAWTNPAGMTGLEGNVIFSGQQFLIPKLEYNPSRKGRGGDDGGNAGSVAMIPGLFWVTPLSDKWRFGLSFVAPLGGASDFGDDWAGRYSVQEITLEGMALSPAVGVQVSQSVSIGFGASIVYSVLDYDFAINREALPIPSSRDGQAKISDADDVGIHGFVGLQWEYPDGSVFGVVYRSEMDVELEGDVHITRLFDMGRARETDIEIDWDNPQWLEIGIRQRLNDHWSLVANADWEDWSDFSDNVFTFDGSNVVTLDRKWKDTYKLGVGAIWKGQKHGIGFGASYDTSPVDDEDRTMDLAIDEQVGVGFSYVRDRDKKLNWALSANFTWLGDGEVEQVQQGVEFAGEFDKNYILFLAGTLTYRFGRS